MAFHPDSLPSLGGKVYIVTGGSSGIGFYTVSHLARRGARVYMAARSAGRAAEAIRRIQGEHPRATQIEHLAMDHRSLRSVATAAERFLEREGGAAAALLHGLVNNAGVMATPLEMTPDGHEAQWQTNYLAHWLLTRHLLPALLRTASLPGAVPGSVRVVNLSSSGHWGAPRGGIDFADTSLKGGSSAERYGQSKLANVLHAKALHAVYGPGGSAAPAGPVSGGGGGGGCGDKDNGSAEIWASAVHPGLTSTGLLNSATGVVEWAGRAALRLDGALGGGLLFVGPDEGCWTVLFAVASPDMTRAHSGAYLQRVASPGWQSCAARDATLAHKLEAWTCEQMRVGGWINKD